MPKYKVKPEEYGDTTGAAAPKDEKHYPTVYFPINKAILDAVEVDQEVVVKLMGKVKMLESREGDSSARQECRIELHEVEMYSVDEYTELAEDETEED